MPVLERTTFIAGRSPAQVLDFCLEGANFPKIFPERTSPLRGMDINDLRISAGRQFSFHHWMWSVIPATWTVVIRKVSDRHFVDQRLQGPPRAFRHVALAGLKQALVAAAAGCDRPQRGRGMPISPKACGLIAACGSGYSVFAFRRYFNGLQSCAPLSGLVLQFVSRA
ncbi:hypothetical protein [Pseudomonas chlororaphis]|uniref:hypothetical protein n=1 Tax=Pseudomonas chlororaphis TaxID=587753 RepID=UPI0023651E7A|nr:hypothetical protein [Pseudomonas chlororaphis]WDH25808.1 hypothetical protein PUP50_16490 [Pseudomonas chlororaphis]